MAGLLLHSMANMRTTITNVLVLMTGGVIISYVEKKKQKNRTKNNGAFDMDKFKEKFQIKALISSFELRQSLLYICNSSDSAKESQGTQSFATSKSDVIKQLISFPHVSFSGYQRAKASSLRPAGTNSAAMKMICFW